MQTCFEQQHFKFQFSLNLQLEGLSGLWVKHGALIQHITSHQMWVQTLVLKG